jgi:hypothetical protein
MAQDPATFVIVKTRRLDMRDPALHMPIWSVTITNRVAIQYSLSDIDNLACLNKDDKIDLVAVDP